MHRQQKATAAFIIFVSARPPFTQPFSKMRNLLSFFMLPLLVLVLVNKIRTHTHNKTQPDPRSTQYTLTNLPTWCTNKVKITTQPGICHNSISNPKLQLRALTTVPVKAKDNTHHHSGSLHYNPKFTPCCCMSTTQTSSPIMTKLPVHGTRSRTGSLKKKNDTAADDLQKLVDRGKLKMREDKKKKRADEKKAEEEKKKKSDQDKAATDTPPRALALPKQLINMITHAPTWKRPSP